VDPSTSPQLVTSAAWRDGRAVRDDPLVTTS
jgi:hypothetical protein